MCACVCFIFTLLRKLYFCSAAELLGNFHQKTPQSSVQRRKSLIPEGRDAPQWNGEPAESSQSDATHDQSDKQTHGVTATPPALREARSSVNLTDSTRPRHNSENTKNVPSKGPQHNAPFKKNQSFHLTTLNAGSVEIILDYFNPRPLP